MYIESFSLRLSFRKTSLTPCKSCIRIFRHVTLPGVFTSMMQVVQLAFVSLQLFIVIGKIMNLNPWKGQVNIFSQLRLRK